ncbi:hypothetical protein LN457_09755, partial [Xanthomonas phaseoli]|uniref:hypothetical protein n=1 Tax=Xanthomonas phaseoli TaxID=1985254 RepID=UPI001E530DD8
ECHAPPRFGGFLELEVLSTSEDQVERPKEGAVPAAPDRGGHLAEMILSERSGHFERIAQPLSPVVRLAQ